MNVTNRIIALLFLGFIGIGILSAQSFRSNFAAEMKIYEQHGLVYSNEKEAYCYNNKIVGLFIDEQRWRRIYSNPAGEIYIKVNRNDVGEIINIIELTPAEYDKISENLDARLVVLNRQMTETRERLLERREKLNQNRNSLNLMPPPIN